MLEVTQLAAGKLGRTPRLFTPKSVSHFPVYLPGKALESVPKRHCSCRERGVPQDPEAGAPGWKPSPDGRGRGRWKGQHVGGTELEFWVGRRVWCRADQVLTAASGPGLGHCRVIHHRPSLPGRCHTHPTQGPEWQLQRVLALLEALVQALALPLSWPSPGLTQSLLSRLNRTLCSLSAHCQASLISYQSTAGGHGRTQPPSSPRPCGEGTQGHRC